MKQGAVPILYVDEGVAFGGSLIVTARLVNALDKNKYRPIVVTAMPLESISYLFDPDIKVISLKKKFTYRERILLTEKFDKLYFDFLFKICIYTFSLIEWFFNRSYSYKLSEILKKYNIQVVHSNNDIAVIKEAHKLGIKKLWHIHGASLSKPNPKRKYWLEQCDHYIAISNYVAELATKNFSRDGNKISVLHNPINPEIKQYDQQEAKDLKNHLGIGSKKVIGVFGRLVEWKGQKEFLDAFKLLASKNQDVCALFVGDDSELGSYRKVLEDKVESENLSERVYFSGFVKDTNKYYQLCDLIVHCSIEPEPFGLVITEAMQNKIPIVVSNLGAAPELVQNNHTGLIADPKKPNQLADQMEKILLNNELSELYVKNAYEFCTNTMDPTIYARKTEAIYENCLNK